LVSEKRLGKMAELQLKVRYRTPQAAVGFGAIAVLTPVWALCAPALCGLVIGYYLMNPAAAPAHMVVLICLGLLSITVAGILLAALFEDDRIQVTKDGLSIPLTLMGLKRRRNFFWNELGAATVVSSGVGPRLILTFGPQSIALSTDVMKKEELEQLLLATELWGTNCNRSPDLILFQTELRNEGNTKGLLSYTTMWEQELGRRFSSTSFIPLEPGHTLQGGRVKVVRQLAFGGFSAIYLAQLNKLDLVVLKEAVVPCSAEPKAKASAEEHLAREGKLLALLSHPQIARVLDCFVEDERHYLLLEHISGQDLRQYVRQNGPQSEAKVIDWGLQLANILDYLHTQEPPIIHRDLTPDNVVMRNDGTLVLIDFGASNQFVGTATGTMIGKQAFISPEQLRGKATTQSDIYAFAGTMFFLLTGKDPTPLMVAHPKKHREDVSDALDALVANCSAMDAAGRPDNARVIAERLRQLQPLAAVGGEHG
jgi:tRNA A-37 threonylcarbamoyl transferase component Bud32